MIKFKRILVPIDFSESSINALRWGCELAMKSGGKLHVFHCYEFSATYAQLDYLTFMETLGKSVTRGVMKDLKALEKQVEYLSQLKPHYELSFDFPLKGISDYARNNDIDLIIMGTQGRNNFTNRLMGSVTSAVIEHTQTTVLAIPDNYPPQEIENIVVADDFKSNTSEIPLYVVAEMANLYNSNVKILHVSKEGKNKANGETDEVLRLAHAFKNIPHSYAFIPGKNSDKSILDFVDKNHPDLLAIFPRKHGLFFTFFKNSITDYVVHRIKIPMLSVKNKDRKTVMQ